MDKPAGSDVTWWKLYRQERRRLGKKWRDVLTPPEIARCAREASRRLAAGDR